MGIKDHFGHAIPLVNALNFHVSNAHDNMNTAPVSRVTHTVDTLRRAFDICVDLYRLVVNRKRFVADLDLVLKKALKPGSVIELEIYDDDTVFVSGEFNLEELRKWLLIKSPKVQVLETELDDNGE